MTRVTVLAVLALACAATPVAAQSSRPIRVAVEFRQADEQRRESVSSSERRVRRSTSIFTLVDDGGEAVLTVATQIPYPQIAFYRSYATGAGHLATGVAFQDVGTALKVQATRGPGSQVRVRLTPRISYVAADGSGAIEFIEAATELVVAAGRPVVLAGSTTQVHAVLRHLLGVSRDDGRSEMTIVLTAQ